MNVRTLCTMLALCGACRIGDPLVDKIAVQPPATIQIPVCEMPEDCSEPFELEVTMADPRPLERVTCAMICDPEVEPGVAVSSDDAFSKPFACEPAELLSAASSADLVCANKRFTADPPSSPTHGRNVITAVTWRNSNVLFEAEAPVEVVFSASELVSVRVHLSGPITLRFQDATKLVGVRISSSSDEASVAFDRVEPEELIIGDGTSVFTGHVSARHSAFTQASFVVGSVELDSASFGGAFIEADDFVSNDGALSDVVLDVDDATFAPALLENVDILSCKSLTFFGSKLESVRIPSCDGQATRLYATDFLRGSIDGRVIGDQSKLEHVKIGENDPSDLVLWETTVFFATFCDQLSAVKVQQHAVQCSACSEAAFDPMDKGCLLAGAFAALDDATPEDLGKTSNFCPALNMLEPCPAPLPTRIRPIAAAEN